MKKTFCTFFFIISGIILLASLIVMLSINKLPTKFGNNESSNKIDKQNKQNDQAEKISISDKKGYIDNNSKDNTATITDKKNDTQKTSIAEKETIIYYSPHADDEILGMGGSINAEVCKGNNVMVVLMTDGAKTRLRKTLPLTSAQLIEARRKEFIESCSALGVEQQNIIIQNYPDLGITKEDAAKVILEFEKKYPNCIHNTMSYKYDDHPDHLTISSALRKLQKQNKVSKARYFVHHIYWDKMQNASYTTIKVSGKQKPYIEKAISAYKLNMPEKGRYAIGYTDARHYFVKLEKSMSYRYHY